MSATGPFLVIVKGEWCDCAIKPCACGLDVVYREAFATLEDARALGAFNVAARTLGSVTYMGRRRVHPAMHEVGPACIALADTGGKITLPNGDVIEVEAASWARLAGLTEDRTLIRQAQFVGHTQDTTVKRAILAAWNAEHGIGIGEQA